MSPVLGVTAATRAYGIVGKPVRHSRSPQMQTAAFAAAGLDACYLAYEVSPEDLPAALEGAAKLGFCGLNVTVPHKVAAFALCREKDESAFFTGAANTLVPCNGGWKAYNTDVAGFLGAVALELGFSPSDGRAVVLGAGGAARAAVAGLLGSGASEVLVAARRREAAESLVADFPMAGTIARSIELSEVPKALFAGSLLVSATPLGLAPDAEWPWDLALLPEGVLVYDMAYGGGPTPLEEKARQAGLCAASGKSMLVLQGAEAFRLWTGLSPEIDAMLNAVNRT